MAYQLTPEQKAEALRAYYEKNLKSVSEPTPTPTPTPSYTEALRAYYGKNLKSISEPTPTSQTTQQTIDYTNMSSAQLSLLTPEQIVSITPDQIAKMSVAQIASITEKTGLTPEQQNQLTELQKYAVVNTSPTIEPVAAVSPTGWGWSSAGGYTYNGQPVPEGYSPDNPPPVMPINPVTQPVQYTPFNGVGGLTQEQINTLNAMVSQGKSQLELSNYLNAQGIPQTSSAYGIAHTAKTTQPNVYVGKEIQSGAYSVIKPDGSVEVYSKESGVQTYKPDGSGNYILVQQPIIVTPDMVYKFTIPENSTPVYDNAKNLIGYEDQNGVTWWTPDSTMFKQGYTNDQLRGANPIEKQTTVLLSDGSVGLISPSILAQVGQLQGKEQFEAYQTIGVYSQGDKPIYEDKELIGIISEDQFNTLPQKYQDVYNKSGFTAMLDAIKIDEASYISNNVIINGQAMSVTMWNDLPSEYQHIAITEGFDKMVSTIKQDEADFISNNIIINGKAMPVTMWNELPEKYQHIALVEGFDAMNEAVRVGILDADTYNSLLLRLNQFTDVDGNVNLYEAKLGGMTNEELRTFFNDDVVNEVDIAVTASVQTGVSLPGVVTWEDRNTGKIYSDVEYRQLVADYELVKSNLMNEGRMYSDEWFALGDNPKNYVVLSTESGRRTLIDVSEFIFPPAKALKPEYTIKDVTAMDWIIGGVQVATMVVPFIPKIASIGTKVLDVALPSVFITNTVMNYDELKKNPTQLAASLVIDAITLIPLISSATSLAKKSIGLVRTESQIQKQSLENALNKSKSFIDTRIIPKEQLNIVSKSYDDMIKATQEYSDNLLLNKQAQKVINEIDFARTPQELQLKNMAEKQYNATLEKTVDLKTNLENTVGRYNDNIVVALKVDSPVIILLRVLYLKT
jgi:hypothetical protein